MSFGIIQTVPLEVFENIVSCLDLGDEARVYATCRNLQEYGRPLLLSPEDRNQKAVLWAIRHNDLELLQRCVEFGASLSVVTVSKDKGPQEPVNKGSEPGRPRLRNPKQMSTLILAARSISGTDKSLRVFQYLRDQGVGFGGISPDALRNQLRALMKSLVSPGRLGVLQTLIESGFIDQVEEHAGRDIAWPLSRAIAAGASEELVQLFVDHGADLNAPHEHIRYGNIVPMAAAMLTSTMDMARLLASRGACYEPDELLHWRGARPSRRPLFAAVQRLARAQDGDLTMVQACLDHGCDINRLERREWPHGWNWDWRPSMWNTTPLIEFLDAIPSMGGTEREKEATRDSLAFLLALGARTPVVPDTCGGLLETRTPSCLEVLLDKWHLESLDDEHVFAMVRMLVEAGCMKGSMGRFMRRHCRGVRNRNPFFAPAWAGWKRLMDLFLAQPSTDPSELLLHLLVDSGTKETDDVERLLVATVDYLIEHGADINAPVSPLNSSPLHMLCTVYQHPSPEDLWWLRSPYEESVVRHRHALLHLMMSRGADPLLPFRGRNSMTELIRHLRVADPSTRAFLRGIGRTMCQGIKMQRLVKRKYLC